jgi:iron complex outermembrane receptor protein
MKSIRKSSPALLLAVAASSFAQDDFALPDETTENRGHEESVQLSPQSITVITRKELDETYYHELEDLEGLSPGLLIDAMSRAPRGAAIAVRGIGSQESSAAFFPAVAVNVDGVYVGTHASQNQVLFDFERVEIARGPQGTFGGTPAMGGKIDFVRPRPTGEFSAHARTSFGDFNRKRFNGAASFPITDDIAGRVAVDWERGGAKVAENLFSNRKENEQHRTALTLSLLWTHDSGATVQYTFDNGLDKSDVPTLLNLSDANDYVCSSSVSAANCSLNGDGLKPETDSFAYTTQNFSNRRSYDIDQHALHVDMELWGHQLKSITARRETNERSNQDSDATSADFYASSWLQDYQQFSQEITFEKQYTPELRYMVGVLFLSTQYDLDRTDRHVIESIADAGRILPVPPLQNRTIDSRQKRKLKSLFSHIDYRLGERWVIDGGARWDLTQNFFHHVVSQPDNFANGFNAPPTVLDGYDELNEISGSVGVSYSVDDQSQIFARLSHGYRPGGFDDTANSADAALPFGEEKVESFELGIKSEWWEDRLRLNYAYYRNNIINKLERYTAVMPSARVESVLKNTSKVNVRGHELELEAVPMSNLRVRASLSHQNADYLSYFIPTLADPTTTTELSNVVPALAPADMFHLSGLYTFPFNEGRVNLYAGYRFTTEYWTNPYVAAGKIDNFTILDFSAEYVWREWTFRLFSRNANDKRYLTNVINVTDAQITSLPPTTTTELGLNTSAEFNQPEFTGFEIIFEPDLTGW